MKSKTFICRRIIVRFTVQKLQWRAHKEKMCITVQPAEVSTKSSSCKMLPRKVLDIEDAGKPSEPVATGLHIDNQVGRNSCRILLSKTTQVCPGNSKSGLGVKLG